MLENIPLIAAGAGLIGLLIAFVLYKRVNSVEIDNEVVADITQEIQDGAMAFLKAEYRVLTIFVVVVGAILAWWISSFALGNAALGFLLALLIAPLIAGVIAMFSDWLILKHLKYDPEATIIATIGILPDAAIPEE